MDCSAKSFVAEHGNKVKRFFSTDKSILFQFLPLAIK